MPVELVLATLKAGFEFGTELMRFYQTPQGKEALDRAWADRQNVEKFFGDLFAGKLFKI